MVGHEHIPTKIDRWLLVRYKKFPSLAEIPHSVSSVMMRSVHDRARVHASFIIMGFCGLAMFANALHGKYLSKQGHSIENNFLRKQEEYNKRKEAELKAQAEANAKQ